ncbi:FkbM family methyltransferase [Humitalea rosea]|uniref:FkbM family methyltransferase n=1 Tax=Humitalea rosea TaxID=990373 RepID=A0A2W7I2E7_9PROT|nr:FkbM family methyltransferase [Humitalea rosea]PZW39435.1 FkbM family methyltransferase [Humitalea rosea]
MTVQKDSPLSEIQDFLSAEGLNASPRAAEFTRILRALDLFVPAALQSAVVARLRAGMLTSEWDAWDVVLDALCEGRDIVLNRHWAFKDRASLQVMLDEIVVREEYFIPPPLPEVPVIVDCGANIGLATYFTKRRYPKARVIAFEPDPGLFATLQANVRRNRFEDVHLHQAAVGGSLRQDVFMSRPDASMAGHLARGAEGSAGLPVDVIPLSQILEQEPAIDLLKIDIEGAEAEALPEAGALLRRCRFIFVECHMAASTAGGGTLLPVLNSLAEQGFGFHVGRSAWSERQHSFRPLRHAHQAASSCVFATRVD